MYYTPKGESEENLEMMRKMDQEHMSVPGSSVYIMPYLLRGLKIDHRNQVWSIDITYIPMAKGFMYLTAIIDVYSRFIVGWSLHKYTGRIKLHRGAQKRHCEVRGTGDYKLGSGPPVYVY